MCNSEYVMHIPQHTYTSQRTSFWSWFSTSNFQCSSNFISVIVINIVIKRNLGRKALFGSQFQFIALNYTEFKTGH